MPLADHEQHSERGLTQSGAEVAVTQHSSLDWMESAWMGLGRELIACSWTTDAFLFFGVI